MKRAYVLVGGASRRFGSDKALAHVRGQPNVSHLMCALKSRQWETSLVGQATRVYGDLQAPFLVDFEPEAGPLAGVITALSDLRKSGGAWCLVVTCDMLVDTMEWLDALERVSTGTRALAVKLQREFIPFPALYASHLLEIALDLWNQGARSMRELHRAIESQIDVVDWPDHRMPSSFNTVEELRRILNDEAS